MLCYIQYSNYYIVSLKLSICHYFSFNRLFPALFFMVLDGVLCNGELSEFLRMGQAANQIPISIGTDELCRNIFSSYLKNCIKCNYLDLNKTVQHAVTFNNPDSLILMHINIRLLNKNFDEFHDYIKSLSFIPSIICLSESRIKNQQVNIDLLAII